MSRSVFCDEEIVAVYRGRRENDDIVGAKSFLDCYHDLAYHITQGKRIVLETENYYISISFDGVVKENKTVLITEYEKPGEWLDPFVHLDDGEPPWVDYEVTLFVGERLLSVENKEEGFELTFDDFVLKVIRHPLNDADFPSLQKDNHRSYNYVLGSERHLKRCDCGGKGVLLLDFVSDYVVRCEKCKRATWAQMTAQDAIEEWNGGHLNWESSNITIKKILS